MRWFIFTLIRLLPFLVVIVLAALACLALRRGWAFKYRHWSSAAPERTARLAETAMIFLLSVIVLSVTAFRPFDGKLQIVIEQSISESLGWTITVVALGLCALTSLPALAGRTIIAALLTGGVLSAYCYSINRDTSFSQKFAANTKTQSLDPFILQTTIDEIEIPAELWLNGVYVGETPATLTRRQIKDIPVWDKPPLDLDPREQWLTSIHRSPSSTYTTNPRDSAWNEVSIYFDEDKHEFRKYFARVRYAGQWLWSSGGHGSNDRYEMRIELADKQQWPGERLIDQARTNNYCVNSDWLAAFDTLDNTGWQRLAKLIEHEPEFAQIVDQWTAWKYGIDRVHTPDEAWALFEQICQEADQSGQYYTNTMAGRAVELLTPKLDAEKLICLAEKLIAQQKGLTYAVSSPAFGKMHFGYRRPELFKPAVGPLPGGATAYSSGSPNERDMRVYVVAHAIWTLDQHLDAKDDQTPNLVEQRVPRALLTWHFRDENALQLANAIGGCPELDRYLLRQDWRLSGTELHREYANQLHFHAGSSINKWLYLLANLNSPAGFAFRQQHRREIMEMADNYLKASQQDELPDFLFMDLDLGPKSLAAEYWSRLISVVRDDQRLETQFSYLVRMEPVSVPDMYVQAWRQHVGDGFSFRSAIQKLSSLPLARQQEVVSALRSEAQRSAENINDRAKNDSRSYLLRELDDCLLRGTHYKAEQIMTDLTGKQSPEMRKAIPEWLTMNEPDHAVVALLADSTDPTLRILVMGALRNHPSPAHRAILTRLLADPDPHVRAAAKQVRADLDQLLATPPQDLLRVPETQPTP